MGRGEGVANPAVISRWDEEAWAPRSIPVLTGDIPTEAEEGKLTTLLLVNTFETCRRPLLPTFERGEGITNLVGVRRRDK